MPAFYAHGKLLLSAEYAIVYGATGLAIPLKKGQRLLFDKKPKKGANAVIKWTAFNLNNFPWMECILDKKTLKPIKKNNYKKAEQLLSTLFNMVSPSFFADDMDYCFETYLEFDHSWGWGSSSTMVSLLAQCTQSNPYEMYAATFKGSGYDLACATAIGPILYSIENQKKPVVKEVSFNPSFKHLMHFGYLGKKANSLSAIANRPAPPAMLIQQLTDLTHLLVAQQNDISTFCASIDKHEQLLSEHLGMPNIKDQLFKNSPLTFKSLGAWGGDFVMIIGGEEDVKQIGLSPIFSWDEIVLK